MTPVRALAYQEMRQDVLASRLKVDALDKQNKILRLDQRLAVQTAENKRLSIALWRWSAWPCSGWCARAGGLAGWRVTTG